VLAWDAATGMLLPHPRVTLPPVAREAVHGNRRACADGRLVRIERISSPYDRMEETRVEQLLQARANREFHAAAADAAELAGQPFAAAFHLEQLLPLLPGERDRLLQRRSAILSAALKETAGNAWGARALARQAVADPASVGDLQRLRAALAKQQDAPRDLLYGAALLRTGSAAEAALVLRAARGRRGAAAAPTEELLLALACARLKRPAEAREYLHAAVTWMRHGTAPCRATCLAGLLGSGTLAALGGLSVPPPDPRISPLDPWTAHELNALRGEVEKALAAQKH
jgi:hypothetical protein